MKYLNSNQPEWYTQLGPVIQKSATKDVVDCDRCGSPLQHNDLCKTCDSRKGRVAKKSYREKKSDWVSKAMRLEGQVGEYPYKGSPVPSTIEELSGKTLKQLAILPRNEGETEVILRALEIMGLEGKAVEQLEELYLGRFGEGQV